MDKLFDFEIDPLVRLSEVEAIIKRKGIIIPVPHRKTLIGWIEEGRWEGEKGSDGWWYVRRSSFVSWVKSLNARPLSIPSTQEVGSVPAI